MADLEITFDEAERRLESGKSIIVWIGSEPLEYVMDRLGIAEGKGMAMSPEYILSMDKRAASSLKDKILVCYHGITSLYIAKFLKEKYAIETTSLKGGITAVVGENF